MAQAAMTFPSDFRWGTATSSHQVEGFNTNNDWWAWEQEDGHILNNDRSGQACDWWANAEADLDIAAEMGTKTQPRQQFCTHAGYSSLVRRRRGS